MSKSKHSTTTSIAIRSRPRVVLARGPYFIDAVEPMSLDAYRALRSLSGGEPLTQLRAMRAVVWSPKEPPTLLAWLELIKGLDSASRWAARCADPAAARRLQRKHRWWLEPMSFEQYIANAERAGTYRPDTQVEAMRAMVWDTNAPPCLNAWSVLERGIDKALELAESERMRVAIAVSPKSKDTRRLS